MQKRLIPIFIIFFIVTFLIFFYILFPADALRKKVETEFSQRYGGHLIIKELVFGFPPSLLLENVRVSINTGDDRSAMSVYIDQVKARPNPFKLFLGELEVDSEIMIANGIVTASMSRRWFGDKMINLLMNIKGVYLEKISLLKEQFGLGLSGSVQADAKIRFQADGITQGEGAWSFQIMNGQIIPPHFPSFNYDSITGSGFVREQKIFVEDVMIKGEDLQLTGKGQVNLGRIINDIYMDMKVQLRLFPKLQKKLGVFASFLPRPDKEGYININLYGPPGDLHFSSKR